MVRSLDDYIESKFDIYKTIEHIKHYLPSQWALKDFIHHNTLHAFQDKMFFDGLNQAYEIFGYKVSQSILEYRDQYQSGRIQDEVINQILKNNYNSPQLEEKNKHKMLYGEYSHEFNSRVGSLRENWKLKLGVDMDAMTYPILFRLLCSYLDQGIGLWKFPVQDMTFLEAIRSMETNGFVSIFKRKRAKDILQNQNIEIVDLLKILVGNNQGLYERYLFDQQFEHQGWSGFVSEVEKMPQMLLDRRLISTHEIILLECLLEIDALDYKLGENNWESLENYTIDATENLFAEIEYSEVFEITKLWQEAFEWSYYHPVLQSLGDNRGRNQKVNNPSYQAVLCIDDRNCSWRRYLEEEDSSCETYGTPGFFGLDMVFQPEGGKFYTKICPAPMSPTVIVKEEKIASIKLKKNKNESHHHESDIHFSDHSYNSVFGWFISQFIGFFSALSLIKSIFYPQRSAATSNSFNHMEKSFHLHYECNSEQKSEGLQEGYTKDEMAMKVFNMLKSIGLVSNFAPIVYIIGHGSTSTNNPYYAGYDCGACSGRAGSVNARVFCKMANDKEVRKMINDLGILIPEDSIFIGGLQDTTQDVVQFYDKDFDLTENQKQTHLKHKKTMRLALVRNAKERARRFETMDNSKSLPKIHQQIKRRAVSLFEPRPEYNHATNALCIVARREVTKKVFLDRRAFLNSYDYRVDPEGIYLMGILNAAAPVCGGINLEYFFSKTDNLKLGSGSKLPHNVMGLFGVANGIEGDLRPGLPAQMVEIHEPVRLMIIVEQFPEVIIKSITANASTYEWFINEWIHLICYHPTENKMMQFKDGGFEPIDLLSPKTLTKSMNEIAVEMENFRENISPKLIA